MSNYILVALGFSIINIVIAKFFNYPGILRELVDLILNKYQGCEKTLSFFGDTLSNVYIKENNDSKTKDTITIIFNSFHVHSGNLIG